MRILVIGATGVLGRPTVRQLVRQGHEVVALVKSAESAAVASFDGATPIIGSLFDERSVATAMTGCKAVMHLATRIPPTRKAHRVSAWVENERIRREGTDILVRVAGLCGVETFIYPSITLVYRDGGAELIEAPDAPIKSAGLATSTLFAERRIAEWAEDKRRAVILRLGNLYGPTSRQSREALALARRGWTVNPAADHAFVPYLWIDDASDALVRALDAPSGTYDVVEDGVLTAIDGRMALAAAVHRKRLRTVPRWMLRWAAGQELLQFAGASRRVSNQRYVDLTGWSPRVRSQRDGWPLLTAEYDASSRNHSAMAQT